MKILVLGASGLLGSHLINNFKKKYRIVGPTRKCLDLSNKLTLKNIEKDFNVVIYCAQYRPSIDAPINLFELEQVNGLFLKSLINYLPKLQKIIYMSTGGLYENNDKLLSESSPLKKNSEMSPYFVSKIRTEEMLLKFSTSIDVNILRIFTMYGVGAHPTSLMPRLKNKIVKQESIISSKNLGDRLRPVHVVDVVNVIEKLLSYRKNGVLNIGGPEVLFFREMVNRIASYTAFEPIFDTSNVNQTTLAPDNNLLISSLYSPKIFFTGNWESNF